jgi:hypothetical protein
MAIGQALVSVYKHTAGAYGCMLLSADLEAAMHQLLSINRKQRKQQLAKSAEELRRPKAETSSPQKKRQKPIGKRGKPCSGQSALGLVHHPFPP